MRARVAHVMPLVMVLTVSLVAQERIPAGPPSGGPAFDVASIKRLTEDTRTTRTLGQRPGGAWILEGMPIAPMIRAAYPSDSSDLPAWCAGVGELCADTCQLAWVRRRPQGPGQDRPYREFRGDAAL